MKLIRTLVLLVLGMVVIPSYALMPPSYLSVKKWKRCVSTYKKNTAEFICIPDRKPLDCPNRSWQQLTEMSNIPACPAPKDEEKGELKPTTGTQPLGATPSH